MKKRPLKRSGEYKARVRAYALKLAQRYRPEIADTFLRELKKLNPLVRKQLCRIDEPYLLAGQHVVLKELFFDSGPVTYCLIHEVTDEYVGLISLWHGVGSRKTGSLKRLWRV